MRVLVTGAASGIGRSTCLRLARDAAARGGASIAAVDVPAAAAALETLRGELDKAGARVLLTHADMGSVEGPARAVGEATARFGGLDGLVSNAGVNRPGPLLDYTVEDWDRLFAVNTRATWLLAKAAFPALKAARGAIVSVCSMSGSFAHAGLGAYGPSKAAAVMLVKVLAQEFGREGIRVNGVSPGMVRTGMTEKALHKIVEEAKSRWQVLYCTVIHRVGPLAPTDQIVLVAVSSAHRGDAFSACEFIMDYLKTQAPFWKKEAAGWVEARASDDKAAERWR